MSRLIFCYVLQCCVVCHVWRWRARVWGQMIIWSKGREALIRDGRGVLRWCLKYACDITYYQLRLESGPVTSHASAYVTSAI